MRRERRPLSSQSPRRWVTVLGAAVSALFLWVAVRHLDLGSVRETWRTAKPLPWVPVAMLAYMVGHFVRGARLEYLVRRERKLQVTTATNVVVVGYASNNVLPARLGELVRAGMLAERTGIPLTQALTVTFIERLVDGVAPVGPTSTPEMLASAGAAGHWGRERRVVAGQSGRSERARGRERDSARPRLRR